MPQDKNQPHEKGKTPPEKGQPKAEAPPPVAAPVRPPEGASADFRYIIRIANTDLDGKRSFVYGLSGVKGIGIRLAEVIADVVEVPRTERLGNLNDAKVQEIEQVLGQLVEYVPPWIMNRQNDWETGEDMHTFGSDVDLRLRDDINLMKKIRCYRGIRHEQGQKVRGQRTRSNGRTGLTVGVVKKAAIAAAQEKAKEEGAKGKEKKE